ncbi:MAG: transcription antitermination factor NusB [Ruminiclostridium sp.]|nr:transcription antitermination factor NusB [Ruminiclostridium sp.]
MSEKLTRREIREGIFLLLFQNELSGTAPAELAEACEEAYEMTVKQEMIKVADAVIAKYDELDGIISQFSKTREINRIPAVNKTILRLALYEIKYSDKIPPKGAVNEAVELSKKYAEKRDSGFINGVLGNYIRKAEEDGDIGKNTG